MSAQFHHDRLVFSHDRPIDLMTVYFILDSIYIFRLKLELHSIQWNWSNPHLIQKIFWTLERFCEYILNTDKPSLYTVFIILSIRSDIKSVFQTLQGFKTSSWHSNVFRKSLKDTTVILNIYPKKHFSSRDSLSF